MICASYLPLLALVTGALIPDDADVSKALSSEDTPHLLGRGNLNH